MSWVLDGHVLKDLTNGTHNIFHQGPHQPLLFHQLTRSLTSIPRSPLREVVCSNVLKPQRCHRHSARSLKVHVEVSRKNHLCPHWPLNHIYHHIPNCCVGEQCHVIVVPVALSYVRFYRSEMFIIVVVFVVVAVFVNVVAVVVFRAGRPPNGPLSPCHPKNGEKYKGLGLNCQR